MTTVDKIIEAAHHLFLAKGYHATSLNEIVGLAEVSKGAFFHYYPSKEALAIDVVKVHYVIKIEDLMYESFKTGKETKAQILDFIDVYYKELVQAYFEGGNLLGNFALELADTSKTMQETLVVLFEKWSTVLNEKLALPEKENRLILSKEEMTNLIIFSLQGATLVGKVFKSTEKSKAEFELIKKNVANYFI